MSWKKGPTTKWTVLSSQSLMQSPIFKMRADRCKLPDGRIMPRYFVMETVDWVNIIPATADGQIVLIEQYRHAAEEMFWEIPGGAMDLDETPEHAAVRELREETGYVPRQVLPLGYHRPNPAILNNRMHSFLALDCELKAETELDPYEDIRVVLKPLGDVFAMMREGQIQHSLILASLALAIPELSKRFGVHF